jgi:hypothetical protein
LVLTVNTSHPLASRPVIEVDELKQERWLRRGYCEHGEQASSLIRSHNLAIDQAFEPSSEADLITLLEANLGVAFAPRGLPHSSALKQVAVNGIELSRTVYVYGVAGRQRAAAAATFLKMLRAADWSRRGAP